MPARLSDGAYVGCLFRPGLAAHGDNNQRQDDDEHVEDDDHPEGTSEGARDVEDLSVDQCGEAGEHVQAGSDHREDIRVVLVAEA